MNIWLKVRLGNMLLELELDEVGRWSDLFMLQTGQPMPRDKIGNVNPLYFIERLRAALTGQLSKNDGWFMTLGGQGPYPTLHFVATMPQGWETGQLVEDINILIKKAFPLIRSEGEIKWENVSVGLNAKQVGEALKDLRTYDDPLVRPIAADAKNAPGRKDSPSEQQAATLTKSN